MAREDAEKVQGALYRIAELASAAQDMQEFYRAVHDVVGELMYADNFYISLYDEDRQLINWPYYVDEIDLDVPDPNRWDAFGERDARGLTAYVLRTGEPQLIPQERLAVLIEHGEIELVGVDTDESSWLGVPLNAEGRTVGVLVVQSYSKEHQYTEQDRDLLAFVGQHVGSALSRARAIEETRERNAELAVINSVQEALAGELDMQAIYDLVGDKIQEIFDAQAVLIMTVDETTGLMHFPYLTDRGGRQYEDPAPLGGFTKHVIERGEPLRINEAAAAQEAAEKVGSEGVGSSEPPQSLLFVPLLTGDRASGVISLQNLEREHAFDDADQRLLTTLAGDLSVALENARLVHETKQRNAELALINSVQSALAGELEMQAIYDVVGDKIQEIFDAQGTSIAILDEKTSLVSFPYLIEHGERLTADPMPLSGGFTKHVLETREPLLINEDVVGAVERYGSVLIAGATEKSILLVPLLTGGRANGAIALSNFDREHAFDDADVRLLTTLAGSLSVALENARLVHETRQRNAELALINSVQEAIAGELDQQAIYDAVGDRIRDVFDAQSTSIITVDASDGLMRFPYIVERGERLQAEPRTPAGFAKHVIETREPLRIVENVAAEAERYGSIVVAGELPESLLFVPLSTGSRTEGVISLQNIDREHAFSESDQQLLQTLASSLSVALENARLVHETRQRNAELALINSVQEALVGELELDAIYESVGDRLRDVFDAQVVDIAVHNKKSGLLEFPYVIERGERLEEEPMELIGFRKHVMETRQPLVIDEPDPEIFERYGNPRVLVGEETQAGLFVPLVVGNRATGVISLQNIDRTHAFSEADVRLLTTLAGSLSVALENARLVHETRQRNAELGLINSVQDALAGELEMQAIYDAVGDRIRDVFDAQLVDIAVYDPADGLVHFPYGVENGRRMEDSPLPPVGFRKVLLEAQEPLLISENMAAEGEKIGMETIGVPAKSGLFVPLVAGGAGRGWISLQNADREHAFSESDQQLLETLASSLGVALENARLVHETRQRNAELALINSVQEALAGELEMQAIYDVVGDKIQEIFDSQVVDIGMFDFAAGLIHYPYAIERGVRYPDEPTPIERSQTSLEVIRTKAPVLVNDVPASEEERGEAFPVAQGEPALSVLVAPLISGDEVRGRISLQNLDRTNAFTENDVRLLTTLAGSLSVALENARLVHETRQRNAELALINSVQDAIAGELDSQAIYDAVGDRIREIFDAQVVAISTLDEPTGLMHYPYIIERGERLEVEPLTPGGFDGHVLKTRESILVRENMEAEAERYGSEVVAGEMPRSLLSVPLVVTGKVTGVISLQNIDREHAFSESDQQLLETLAGSLSVALENARLVHETRQRNAELALINSVQDAIAGELDQQAIYDAVGDRIQEIFDAQVVAIRTLDTSTGLVHAPYIIERGERMQEEPMAPVGFSKHVFETRKSVLIVEKLEAEAERYGSPVLSGEAPKSVVFVPLMTGGRATGVISLQNIDREHAFTESDKQLLETLAGSLSVALENARLVHETRQRNAELALINGVQEAIAGELDSQAIYDAVGDRIRNIFDAQVVAISTFDEATGLQHYPYVIERGERVQVDDAFAPMGFSGHVFETREPLLIAEDMEAEAERYGSPTLSGSEDTKSALFVPLITSGRVVGVISLQNIDREHAFSESDQQLLETLAGSLSVALENARLVHETRQRNAELALINSVQDAIAGELDSQAIYDAVGNKIQEIFDAQTVTISTLDETTTLLHYPYIIERGQRLEEGPGPVAGFSAHVLGTGEPLLIVEDVEAESERYGSRTIAGGEDTKSVLFVPLVSGGKPTGVISLQNVDREHAFSESDQQLLETLAGSLSVALENARLVHETRQRNAELALINGVQEAIAGELEPQAIYDAVGDRIQEVFDAQSVFISTLDPSTGLVSFPYIIERGERLAAEPGPPLGVSKHVLETGESLLFTDVEAQSEQYESLILAGEWPKSSVFVPLVSGGRSTGVISLQNVDRTYAFGESDRQLLETLAGSLSVALENARLVHETRQRNAELALITSVQEAIAGELDSQAIYDAVGDRIRDVFDAQVVSIATVDETSGLVYYPYLLERDERLQAEPRPLAGFAKHVLETRRPLLLAENLDAESERYGSSVVAGERPRSVLFVPLIAGGKATGVISLQNIDREHAFDEADQQLLTTVAGSVSVALENARLVQETQQRVGELATVNSVGQALASQLDLDGLIELVGEQVRETFGADIAYVALHDQATGRIEFPYYYETGERPPQTPLSYGEGITSQILRSREPLLRNRREQHDEEQSVGTPSLSYLGVPILVGERAIGVISVQSIEEEGRFSEADMRLLSTLAANVGVAIQNARLFTEVERQRQYLESLVSITPAAVVVMDDLERVTAWNPAAAELFGYSAEEAVGRPVDELVFGSSAFDSEEGREITREALEEGRAQRITQRRRRDGTLVDVELLVVPLTTVEGAHGGLLAIYHDVTELQRARQEAEAATQAKSAFLATMSHEIRTPMNAVIGMTDLLLGTELTGEQREFAEVVHSSGDALLHVIDDILDYSKIEAGKLDLEHQPFNLRDCVEGALDIVAPRAWEKEIELGCLIDEGAPAGIVGDEARLRQVLLNLLSNAVKFTETGEVVVLVDAEETGAGTYRVDIAVRDTGIGIPQDRMDRLFTSFSQVDASTTRKFGGTGLGLAISKRLVELMGGEISVESEQKKGSTFRISLPVAEVDVPAKIAHEDGLAHLAGKRILVVDDNATNREIVTRHALSWGMEPVSIELPSEALALVESGDRFDVAVLDMMMPVMDGLALAGEIRARRSAEELPLLLLTSLGRLPQAESGSVFSAQLAKPFKASQLYNTLLRLLTPGGAAEEEVEPVTDGKRARSALRILLAEDNAMNQKVALRLLEQLGYRADVANNGLEAIAALERQSYDVVLMDVQMPELDGLDATRRICEQWPEETRPHIIAMTANALPEDREACFAAGMNDYVAKPIRAEELVAALKRARPRGGNGDVELDAAALGSLRDLGGDEFLGEVIDAFLADAPDLIATLRRSLAEQGTEELRRAAHTLKSNGATLGAEDFAGLCRTLEQHAKDGELEGAGELVDRIEQEYGPLRDALATLRSESVS